MDYGPTRNFLITAEKQGPAKIAKGSFPLRYGNYSEIKTSEYEFVFNLNGEIKFIRGLGVDWPHPAEQLKRTDGNDWVYYTVGDFGGDKGVKSWLGEYYLPCLPYPSNAVWEVDYFSNPRIMNAFAAWSQLYGDLYMTMAQESRYHAKARKLIESVLANHDGILRERSQTLNEIIGGRLSVLPPDARHVDYEVVPLNIADGCLYHCGFCCVKTDRPFRARTREEVVEQIGRLKDFYGRNLENYNGLFLGNHDALAAGKEAVLFAASEACQGLGFDQRPAQAPFLFLFGSVHSFLKADRDFFDRLERLPFYTYVNIGLESIDEQILQMVGKPLKVAEVRDAFDKMPDINAKYGNIEVTVNFLIGDQLSSEHYRKLSELLRDAPVSSKGKGAIYLSPLKDSSKKRELLPVFYELKKESRIPVFAYLIQRL